MKFLGRDHFGVADSKQQIGFTHGASLQFL